MKRHLFIEENATDEKDLDGTVQRLIGSNNEIVFEENKLSICMTAVVLFLFNCLNSMLRSKNVCSTSTMKCIQINTHTQTGMKTNVS